MLCHYVIVRRDLPDGFREAQLGHAIGQSLIEPHPDGMYVVVLAVRDEAHLFAEASRLELAGVVFSRVVENDGPFAGQLTAVGLKPGRKGVVGRYVSCLPRLR